MWYIVSANLILEQVNDEGHETIESALIGRNQPELKSLLRKKIYAKLEFCEFLPNFNQHYILTMKEDIAQMDKVRPYTVSLTPSLSDISSIKKITQLVSEDNLLQIVSLSH